MIPCLLCLLRIKHSSRDVQRPSPRGETWCVTPAGAEEATRGAEGEPRSAHTAPGPVRRLGKGSRI